MNLNWFTKETMAIPLTTLDDIWASWFTEINFIYFFSRTDKSIQQYYLFTVLSTAPIISTGIIQGVQQWTFPLSISQIHSSPPHFRTINQIIRKGPLNPKPKKKSVLDGNPQMKGIVLQVMIRKPKKPNSAQRKCCRVRLSNGKELTAYIPGVGHTLQEHNVVLVEAGRTQDLPGIKIKVIRGKYDCAHPVKRWLHIVSNTAIICFNIFYLGLMCTRQSKWL